MLSKNTRLCLYSAWASRCRFIRIGNAKASVRGTAIVGLHAFFMFAVKQSLNNNGECRKSDKE